VRKQRISALDRVPRTEGEPYSKKPSVARKEGPKKPAPRKNENRRVRQTSDLTAPDAQKNSMQKKSDRNRGRG
jgi:23S rRNA pseudouridine2605 synthase